MDENYSKSITIRVDDDLYEKILKHAATENRKKSEFVRHTVITYIKRIEEAEDMRKGRY